MQIAVVVLAILAFVAGLIAAWKWYESSIVPLDMGMVIPWDANPPPGTSEDGWNSLRETMALSKHLLLAAPKNKSAARWTALSVALNAANAIIGVLGASAT